mmetsp:Transcript_3200/g.9005  ORF Transcript_3200/g.9005 Transcript_3200/m.9005 type:complete len:98 (-) Transcript_3200:23-316(-)
MCRSKRLSWFREVVMAEALNSEELAQAAQPTSSLCLFPRFSNLSSVAFRSSLLQRDSKEFQAATIHGVPKTHNASLEITKLRTASAGVFLHHMLIYF